MLLVLRPRRGLVLGAAIMLSDVTINAAAFTPTGAFSTEWPFWLQATFAAFLLSVSPYCWRRAEPRGRGEPRLSHTPLI